MDIEGAMDTNNDDASSCAEPAIVDESLATVNKYNESLDEMFDSCQQNTIEDQSPPLAAKENNCQTEPPGSENCDEVTKPTVSDEVQTVEQLLATVEAGNEFTQTSAVSDHSPMAVDELSNEERNVPTCSDNFTSSIQSVSDSNKSFDVNEALQTFVPNSTEQRDVSNLDFIESMMEDTKTTVELEAEKLVNTTSMEPEINSFEKTSASDLHFQTDSNLFSLSNNVDIHPRPVPSIVISTDLKEDMPVEISNTGDTNLTSLDDVDVFQTLSQSGDDNKDEMDKFLQTVVENEADNDKNFSTENDAITPKVENEGVTQNSEGDSACTEIDLADDEVCMNIDSADDETYAIIDLADNVSANLLDDEVRQSVNSEDEETSTKVESLNDKEFSNAEQIDEKLTIVDFANEPCAVDTTNVEADITEANDEDVPESDEFSEVKTPTGFDLLESLQTQQDTEAEADVTVHKTFSAEVAAPDILEITDEASTKVDSPDVEACEKVISDDARVNTTNVEANEEANAQYVEADVKADDDDPNVEEDDVTLTKCDDTAEVDTADVVGKDDDQTEFEANDRDKTQVHTEDVEITNEDQTEVDTDDVEITNEDQTEVDTDDVEITNEDQTEVDTDDVEIRSEDQTEVDTADVEIKNEDQTEVDTAAVEIKNEDQTEVDTADVEIKNEDQTEVDTADVEIKNEDQTEVDTADVEIRSEDQTEVDTADVEIKNEDQTEVDTDDVEIRSEDQTEVDTADVEIKNEDQTEVDTADVEIKNENETEVDTADVEIRTEDQTIVDTADVEAHHTVESDDEDHAEVDATSEETSTEAAQEQDSGDKLKEHIKARYPELDELAQEYLGESSNSDIGQEDLAKLSSKYLDDVDDVADNDEISKSQDPTIEMSSKDDSDSEGRTEDAMEVCKEEETSLENKDSFQQGQSMEGVSSKEMLETTDLSSTKGPSLSTDPLAEAALPSGSEVQKEIKDDKTTNTEKEMENTDKEARNTEEAVKAEKTWDTEKEREEIEKMVDEKDKKITAEKSPDKPSPAAPLCKHFQVKGTCPLNDNCAFRHLAMEKVPPDPPVQIVPVKVSSPIKRKSLDKETNSSKRKYRSNNRREDEDKTTPSGGEPAPPGTEDIVLPGRIPSVYSKQAGPNFSSSAEANPESTKPFDSATLLAKRSQIRCKHFLRGYCHYGENCHFKHESDPVTQKTPSYEDEKSRYDPRRQKKRSRSKNRYSRSRSRERYRRRRRSRSRNSRSPSGKRHHRRSRSRSYDKYRRNSKSSSKPQYRRRSRSLSSERYRRRSRSASPDRNQRTPTTQSRTYQKHSRTPEVQEKRSASRYEESHQRSGQRSQESYGLKSKSSDSYGRQSLSSSPDSYGRRSRSKSVERRYSGEKNKRTRSPSTEKQYSSQNSQSIYGKRTVSGWGSCERVVIIQPKCKTKSAEHVSKRRKSRSRSPNFKSSAANQPQAKSRDNTFWNKLVASVDPIRSGNSTKQYRDGYYDQPPGDKTKKVSADQSRKASATIPFVGESKDSDFLSPEEMFIKKMNEFKRRIEKSDESKEETTIKLGMTSDQLTYSSSGYYHSTDSGIYKGDLSKSLQKEQNKTAASYYHEQEAESRGMMPPKLQPSASSTMTSYQGQATANPPTNNLAHILQQLSSWQNAADKSAAQVQPPVQAPIQFPVQPQIQVPVPVPPQQTGGNQEEKEMLAKVLAEAIMKQSSGDHQIQAGALANLAGNIAASSRDQGRLHQPYDYGPKDGRSTTGYGSSDYGRSASNYPSEYVASAEPSRGSEPYDPYNSRAMFKPSQTTSYAVEDRSGRSYPSFGASRADPHYGQPGQYNNPPTHVSNQVSFGYSNSASTSSHGRDGYDVADGNYQGSSQYGNYRQREEGSMPGRGGPPKTQSSHPGQSSNSLFQLQRDYEEPNYDDHAPSNRTLALTSVLVQPTIVNKSQKYRALGSLDVKSGSDINSFIKYMVKTAFIGGKTVRAVVKKYLVPKNCTFLIPPMLNSEVYSDLPPNIKAMDAYLHDCHQWLSKGALPLIEQIQRLGRVNQTLADFCFRGGDTLTLLGYACVNMSMKRRLMLKNGLAKEYHVLCRSSNRITDFLFGDHLGQDLSMLQSQNLLYPSKDSETTLSYVTDLTAIGAYVGPEVVEMVRLACMHKGHISDLREKYGIPANCQNMIPPKVNLEIVKIASYESLEHDHFLQKIQLHVAEAIVPCLHILEKIHEKKLDTSTTLGYFSDAIILLGNAMFTLSKFRLDLMREASPPHLQPLCVWR